MPTSGSASRWGSPCLPSCSSPSPRMLRIPIDNPATHLELTMVHEAMVLEYSGRHLAMIEARRGAEARAVFLVARLPVPAVRNGDDRQGLELLASGSQPTSPSFRSGNTPAVAKPRSPRCACSATRFSWAAHLRRLRLPCSCCSFRKASDDAESGSTSPISSPAPCWC